MSQVHSFFVPDADYLVDLPGLITYLGEKIAVGNICIYCNEKGREFRTLEAVRKHMVDKSHCKIGYDTLNDRIEISDFFDFTASYTNVFPRPRRKNENALAVSTEQSMEEGVWEDISGSDDSDVDEVIEIEPDGTSEEDKSDEDDREIPPSQVTYGDSPFELVLPSGKRLGHRSLRRYYAQSFPTVPRGGNQEDPTSGAALVRRLLADKNSALVPRKGGFGAFGSGTDIIKARNHGEAREAGRHIREHRDQRRREEFKTKIGFIHNSQKHYRDPCESHNCSSPSIVDEHLLLQYSNKMPALLSLPILLLPTSMGSPKSKCTTCLSPNRKVGNGIISWCLVQKQKRHETSDVINYKCKKSFKGYQGNADERGAIIRPIKNSSTSKKPEQYPLGQSVDHGRTTNYRRSSVTTGTSECEKNNLPIIFVIENLKFGICLKRQFALTLRLECISCSSHSTGLLRENST